jgi:FkbM family methyltransferase
MQNSDFSRIGNLVARHRRNPFARKMAAVCRRYLAWYANLSYDLKTNGETFVLQTLASFEPRVMFDVGANFGDWSVAAARACPNADIHAFEIARPTFELLQKNTKNGARIHCRNFGLADAPGTMRIRYCNAFPALTTATAYPHPFSFSEIPADVTTGDEYSAAAAVQHIDFLKIDVEGMEDQVLSGFQQMFERRAIDVVQFEYGRVSIINRFLLRDFYAFFRPRGYVIGKIFPTYVDFRDYELGDEDFMGPNYLACLEEKTDYLDAFRGRSQ